MLVPGDGESIFFKGMMAHVKLTTLQWVSPCLGEYGQHFGLNGLLKRKKKEGIELGGNRGVGTDPGGVKGRVEGEYDQNTV